MGKAREKRAKNPRDPCYPRATTIIQRTPDKSLIDTHRFHRYEPCEAHCRQNTWQSAAIRVIRAIREKTNSKKAEDMILRDVTYQIRGAIFDVYNELGPGLLESVYEEALVYELQVRGMRVERQQEVPIMYKGESINTSLRLDILVEDKVIVELKSVKELQDVHFKQLLTYCRLADKRLGILVNFNTDDIEKSIRRVAN